MIQVIRRPGGGWERQADGSKGQKLWHNVRGHRTLTVYGRQALQDWYDLTIHIPVIEQELRNNAHPHNDAPRETYYPVSEASLPGLTAQLGGQQFDVRNAQVIPPNVKVWILAALNMTTDGRDVIDEGSDRFSF